MKTEVRFRCRRVTRVLTPQSVGMIRDPSDTRSSGIPPFTPVFVPSEIGHGETVGICSPELRLPLPSGQYPPLPSRDTQDVAPDTRGTILESNTLALAPLSPVEFTKKVTGTRTKVNNPRALGASSTAIPLPIGSPSYNPLDARSSAPGTSRELNLGTTEHFWRTSYEAAKAAVEIAEDSDIFLSLKAVVEALAVLVQNCEVKCTRTSCSIDH